MKLPDKATTKAYFTKSPGISEPVSKLNIESTFLIISTTLIKRILALEAIFYALIEALNAIYFGAAIRTFTVCAG